MRRLIDVGFILLIMAACTALDFYIQRRDSMAAQFTLADYIALRKDHINDILNPPSLNAALPSAVEGWDVSRAGADRMQAPTDENRAQQANEIAMVKAVNSLARARAPKGQSVGLTMTKGETRLRMVAMQVDDGSDAAPAQPAAIDVPPEQSAALQNAMLRSQSATDTPAYDIVDGVAFTEIPVARASGDPDMRMMRADLAGEVSVTVITQSRDDEAIKQALQAIDFVMLNKLLAAPVAGVEDGRTTDLRQDPSFVVQTGPAPAPLAAVDPAAVANAAPVAEPAPASIPATIMGKASDINLAAAAKPQVLPDTPAAFQAAPTSGLALPTTKPCVRRAGILVCT